MTYKNIWMANKMKVYITYHNYDNYEYSLWGMSENEVVGKDTFKLMLARDFPYIADDCSYLYLVETEISEEDYKVLVENSNEDEVQNILEKIENNPDTIIIFEIYGGDLQ